MTPYVSIDEAKQARDLRLVIVKGLPSPWSQAAKTIFELKGLPFLLAPYVPFAENPEVVDWAGEGAPVAAWNDARAAGARIAKSLGGLSGLLHRQRERGSKFFVGNSLSALDLYWVAFMNLIAPLPVSSCPIPSEWRESFVATDPLILEALSPALLDHRERIFAEYWRDPMEF